MPPPKSPASDPITRREFVALVQLVEQCCRNIEVQFKRIAQIQAELDLIHSAWNKRAQRRTAREKARSTTLRD